MLRKSSAASPNDRPARRWCTLRISVGLLPLYVSNAVSQTIGPGIVTTTINVSSGTTTVVGNTAVVPPGYAARVTGGTLVIDPSGGPIALNTADFDRNAIYATGGSVDMRLGPTQLFTSGDAAPALFTQNTGVSATSAGGLVIHTTGGYGLVFGLPVGSYGAVADSNSFISLTNATILTEGQGANGAYALGSQISLNGVSIETRGAAYTTGSTFGAYGVLANTQSGIRGTLSMTGGSLRTAGDVGYGMFAIGSDITASGTTITTAGNRAYAIFAQTGSTIVGSDLTVNASGPSGYGVNANAGSTITLQDSRVATTGTSGWGVVGQGSGSRVNLTNVAVTTVDGPGVSAFGAAPTDDVQARLIGGSVQTAGVAGNGYGLFVRGALARTTADGVQVSTAGQDASAARIIDGTLTATNLTLRANGAGAPALSMSGGVGQTAQATFQGGLLTSAQSDAIVVDNGAARVGLTGATVTGSPNWLRVAGGLRGVAGVSPDDVSVVSFASPGLSGVGVNIVPGVIVAPLAGPVSTAVITASGATLNGAALTESGATSDVSLTNATVWNLTGNSNLTNLTNDASRIIFSPPTGDPTQLGSYKTLTANNYIGNSGRIGLNTYLDTDGAPSDRLIINTGLATGTSSLRIGNTAGLGALTTRNGILVVDTINGGTTAAGAFSLAGPVAAGPYDYTLFRSSVDATNPNAWYLRSTLDCTLDPTAPSCQTNPPLPPPDYRPETSLYPALPAMALLYGRGLVDTLHERVGEEEDIRGRKNLHQDAPYTGGWIRAIGIHGQQDGSRFGSVDGSPQYNYNFFGLQGGQDLSRREHADGSRDHLGAMFAIGGANGKVTHTDGTTGTNKFTAYSFGGYWTHFGPQDWYFDAVAIGTYFDMTSSANRGIAALSPRGAGLVASAEVGRPIRFANGYFIEPQAQAIYQLVNLGEASDGAATINFRNAESLAGRVGARFGRSWNVDGSPNGRQLTVWLRPNFWYEFSGNPIARFSSADGPVPFQSTLHGAWGEINGGISGQINARTTLFANASYNERFDRKGSSYNGKAGVRVNW